MKTMQPIILAVLALATLAPGAGASQVTPVQKVITLLTNMLTDGQEAKKAEQVEFAAYKQFCDDTTTDKTRAIKEANEKIEMLTANIQKYEADAATLAQEIAEHDGDIAAWTGDKKAATQVRDIEAADFATTSQDYSESIDALGRAISFLKSKAHDIPQASLMQLTELQRQSTSPAEAMRAVSAFLAQEPAAVVTPEIGDKGPTAPKAVAYEFRSHGIIETLEGLLDKFKGELTSLEKEEMNTKHAFDLLVQDIVAQVGKAEKDRDEKAAVRAKKLQAAADAKVDRADTTATRDADEAYLADLTSTCSQKASDFESRQQLRTDEIAAIQQAISILSGEAVSGNAVKHLPTLLQGGGSKAKAAGLALAQLRSGGLGGGQARAAQFLQAKASQLGSTTLSALAARVAADPFAKVKKMIQDLIVRLQEEATEEASHKGWCDAELATNEQTRAELTSKVEVLHAEIDELEASIAMLTRDIGDLTQAVADLDAAMAKETAFRAEEKANNTETIKDATDAQAAVQQATTVLKEFYAKAGEATALAQQQKRQDPEIFTSSYKGMQAENGGVIGMLEVILSDFARLESETKAAEATAQSEYEEFMKVSEADKAAKVKDIEHKTAKRQDEEQAKTTKTGDLAGTQKELDASLAYYDKLKPSCVNSGVKYEDRVARREEEIESLREALQILSSESV